MAMYTPDERSKGVRLNKRSKEQARLILCFGWLMVSQPVMSSNSFTT